VVDGVWAVPEFLPPVAKHPPAHVRKVTILEGRRPTGKRA
jgi:hypothetical protein